MLHAVPASAAPVAGGSTGGSVGFSGHIPPTTPSGGDLDLVWVPRAFEFGNSNANTTAAKTYAATNGATKYVVVRDQRVANGTTQVPNAWELTAQASTLVDGGSTLTGAQYTFSGNQLKNYNSVSGTDTEAPESVGAIDNALPGGHTAAVTANVTLPADGTTTVKVMEALPTTIDGKYATELNNISLVIPANTSQEGKQYVGTVDWSLDDTI
ncbi:WxL domain-containing protein [Enterococcus hulanensis]|uniref:WxL domain-containing protein n=1 Tax=Enterococcus hulanensis TaxID=2559929 RepID=UPI001484D656|nr:WxL domain-containing protein [Enterococcus hulanensis]